MDTKLTTGMFWQTKRPDLELIFAELAGSPRGRWLLQEIVHLASQAHRKADAASRMWAAWPESLTMYPREEQPQRPEVGPLMAGKSCEDGSVYLGYGTLEGKLLLVLPDFRALQPKASIRPSSPGAVYMTLRSIGAVGFNGRIEDQRPVRWRVTNPATGKQQTYMREADALSEKAHIVSMLQDNLPTHFKDFVKIDPDTVTVEEVRE